MSALGRLLCLLRFHRWLVWREVGYRPPTRQCSRCNRLEMLHRGYGTDEWFEVEP